MLDFWKWKTSAIKYIRERNHKFRALKDWSFIDWQSLFPIFEILREMGMHHRRAYTYMHTYVASDIASWSSRDALQKRLDTVMQYICLRRLRSSILLLDAIGIDAVGISCIFLSHMIYHHPSVYIYIYFSVAHTSTGKKRDRGIASRKNAESKSVLLPFRDVSALCAKERTAESIANSIWGKHLLEGIYCRKSWNTRAEILCKNPFGSNSSPIALLIKDNISLLDVVHFSLRKFDSPVRLETAFLR